MIPAGRNILLVFLAISAAAVLRAQAGLVDLTVIVVNGVTREPVSGATFSVSAIAGGRASAGLPRPTTDGRLTLATGWYGITSHKDGWLDGALGQDRPGGLDDYADLREPGSHLLQVAVWPAGVIEGTVVDDTDRPINAANVKILARRPANGDWQVTPGNARTDERGHFLLAGRLPGDYFVAVMASPETAQREVSGLSLLPVFYPSGRTLAEAQPISVETGETGRVLIRVPRSPLVPVSGVVRSPAGDPVSVPLRLAAASPVDDGPFELALRTVSGAAGTFTFPPVPVGEYRIDVGFSDPIYVGAETPGWWASERVGVTDGPHPEVTIQLRAGFRVSGRIDNSPDRHDPSTIIGLARLLGPDRYTAALATFRSSTFHTGPAAPGRYFLMVAASGSGVIEDVTRAGQSIIDAPFVIDRSDITDVVVSMSAKPLPPVTLKLTGIPSDGCHGHNCRVAFFPVDEHSRVTPGDAPISRRFRLERVLSDRVLTLNDIPPGDYYAAIIDPKYADNWPAPETLKAIVAFATRVTVVRGQATSVELKR